MFVITGPSGVGKTEIVREVVRRSENDARGKLKRVVTTTTRPPRRKNDGTMELEGVDYYFFQDPRQFQKKILEGAFVEWDEYPLGSGFYYGTMSQDIINVVRSGYAPVSVLTMKGAESVKKRIPGTVVISIIPSSLCELENRLKNRGDDPESIAVRLEQAEDEIRQGELMSDYTVFNPDGKFEDTVRTAQDIIGVNLMFSV